MEKELKKTLELRDKALQVLNGKMQGFFLAGGTALSAYYFHHRESFDLDFFTKDFSEQRIRRIISEMSDLLRIKIEKIERLDVKDKARILRCYAPLNDKNSENIIDESNSLKVEFVEDVYRYVGPQNLEVSGIPVLSKENIYLRKIYAACGVFGVEDDIGRKRFISGRQEAKDFFDLYYLSKIFMPLSKFVDKYCNSDEEESVIVWYKAYNRERMQFGVLDIITEQTIDYREMEQHFQSEIESMVEKGIE